MGKYIFGTFVAVLAIMTGTFVAVAYDMEVLATGGRNTIILSERVDGTQKVVAVTRTGDEPSMMYPSSTEFEVDRITVTLMGRESYLGKNLNRWLRQRIDPSANIGDLYRQQATGALIIH